MRYSRPGPSHTGPWQAMLKIVIFILKAVGSHYRNLRRVECSDFSLVSITYAPLQRTGCRGKRVDESSVSSLLQSPAQTEGGWEKCRDWKST